MTEIDTTSAGGPLTILDAAEELLRLRGLREALDARVDAIKAAVLEIAKDTSVDIENSVKEVEHHLVIGGIMAVITVMLFLLNFRSTCISALVASWVGS